MSLHLDESTQFFFLLRGGIREGVIGGRISGSELGVGFLAELERLH